MLITTTLTPMLAPPRNRRAHPSLPGGSARLDDVVGLAHADSLALQVYGRWENSASEATGFSEGFKGVGWGKQPQFPRFLT